MSRLSDQVEARIARANRAFRLSSRIIAAAHRELESHGQWLDRHRATWAEEVKRHRRLFHRKLAMRAFTRFTAGLIFAAPFALARALAPRLNNITPGAAPKSRPPSPAPDVTPHDALQHRIRGLDGVLGTKTEVAARPANSPIDRGSPPRGAAASRVFAAFGNIGKRTVPVPVPALGLIALLLVAAAAVRGTPSPLAEASIRAPRAAPVPLSQAAASVTVTKSAVKAVRPAPVSGFAVLAAVSSSEALRLPPQTIAEMMAIARPSPLAVAEPEAAVAPEAPAAPLAAAPVATKPAAKAKPKRQLARREAQPVPWWQEWSWIRVR